MGNDLSRAYRAPFRATGNEIWKREEGGGVGGLLTLFTHAYGRRGIGSVVLGIGGFNRAYGGGSVRRGGTCRASHAICHDEREARQTVDEQFQHGSRPSRADRAIRRGIGPLLPSFHLPAHLDHTYDSAFIEAHLAVGHASPKINVQSVADRVPPRVQRVIPRWISIYSSVGGKKEESTDGSGILSKRRIGGSLFTRFLSLEGRKRASALSGSSRNACSFNVTGFVKISPLKNFLDRRKEKGEEDPSRVTSLWSKQKGERKREKEREMSEFPSFRKRRANRAGGESKSEIMRFLRREIATCSCLYIYIYGGGNVGRVTGSVTP